MLAFPGRKLSSNADPHTAPSEGYPNGCSLVFSTMLLLSTKARSNIEREQEKRRPLQRFGPVSELPLETRKALAEGGRAAQSLQHTDEATRRVVTNVLVSDRVGHPFVIVKLHAKDPNKKQHFPWSQRSTPLQHGRDLVQVLQGVLDEAPEQHLQRTLDLHRCVVAPGEGPKRLVPWLVITSDGGGDETPRRLQTLLVLAAIMQHFDLDGVEKVLYCPYHSKMNPDERVNSTVKRQLSGNTISAGDRSRQALIEAREHATRLLLGKTHGGEPLRVLVAPLEQPDNGLKVTAADVDMDTIDDFVVERSKFFKNDFRALDQPATDRLRQEWQDSLRRWQAAAQEAGNGGDDLSAVDLASFYHLEQLVQFLRKHIVSLSLYNVVVEKCDGVSASSCDWCREHPRRGSYSFRQLRKDKLCPEDAPCPDRDFCQHALFREIDSLLHRFEQKTPENLRPKIKCSLCKQPGHNRRKCPQRPPEK